MPISSSLAERPPEKENYRTVGRRSGCRGDLRNRGTATRGWRTERCSSVSIPAKRSGKSHLTLCKASNKAGFGNRCARELTFPEATGPDNHTEGPGPGTYEDVSRVFSTGVATGSSVGSRGSTHFVCSARSSSARHIASAPGPGLYEAPLLPGGRSASIVPPTPERPVTDETFGKYCSQGSLISNNRRVAAPTSPPFGSAKRNTHCWPIARPHTVACDHSWSTDAEDMSSCWEHKGASRDTPSIFARAQLANLESMPNDAKMKLQADLLVPVEDGVPVGPGSYDAQDRLQSLSEAPRPASTPRCPQSWKAVSPTWNHAKYAARSSGFPAVFASGEPRFGTNEGRSPGPADYSPRGQTGYRSQTADALGRQQRDTLLFAKHKQ